MVRREDVQKRLDEIALESRSKSLSVAARVRKPMEVTESDLNAITGDIEKARVTALDTAVMLLTNPNTSDGIKAKTAIELLKMGKRSAEEGLIGMLSEALKERLYGNGTEKERTIIDVNIGDTDDD